MHNTTEREGLLVESRRAGERCVAPDGEGLSDDENEEPFHYIVLGELPCR